MDEKRIMTIVKIGGVEYVISSSADEDSDKNYLIGFLRGQKEVMPIKCLAQVTTINNNFLFTLIVLLLNISAVFFNKINETNNISVRIQ